MSEKRKKSKWWIWPISILLVGFVVAEITKPFAGKMLMTPFRNGMESKMPEYCKSCSFSMRDGVNLRGWETINSSDSEPKAVVILLHGISDSKESRKFALKFLLDRGWKGVAIDQRAHGESEGEYATYGVEEKKDIKEIIDVMSERYPNAVFGIWGTSFGGAVSLQSLAYDERLDFGIVESTFFSLPEVVQDYVRNWSGLDSAWFAKMTLDSATKIVGEDMSDVKPGIVAKKISQPVLLFHGNKDEKITLSNGKRIAKNLTHPDSEFVIIEGAGHDNLMAVGRKETFPLMDAFIKEAIRNQR